MPPLPNRSVWMSRRCLPALALVALVCVWVAVRVDLNLVEIPALPAFFQPVWDGEPLPSHRARAEGGAGFESYLTVCTLVKNEGRYLREWVEFHRLVGATRFDVYDDGSTDGTAELLRQLGAGAGDVRRIAWPPAPEAGNLDPASDFSSQAEAEEYARRLATCRRRDAKEHFQAPCQLAAFSHCVARHRTRSRWVGIFDVDEFIFPRRRRRGGPSAPSATCAPPGGRAPRGAARGGTGGAPIFPRPAPPRRVADVRVWQPPPPGVTTLEAYQRRAPAAYGREGLLGRFMDPPAKSLFDPRAVARALVHRHAYVPGSRVYRVPAEAGVIRYFHFQYKSMAEARAKAEANGNPKVALTAEKDAALSAVPDATAAVFLPLLRARLAQPLPPDPGPAQE
eukprot:tig00001052_g6610.t1